LPESFDDWLLENASALANWPPDTADPSDVKAFAEAVWNSAYTAGVASEVTAREKVEASILVILDRLGLQLPVVETARIVDAIYRAWRDNDASLEDTLTVMAKPLADLSAALKVLGPAAEKLGQQP
jgi:hypothetical protein